MSGSAQTGAVLARRSEQPNLYFSVPPGQFRSQTMKSKLVVVTDLAVLKAYHLHRPDPDSSLHLDLLESMELTGAHEKMTDQVSDLAGRFGKGGGPGAGASFGERHNIELEHRKRLVRQLTDKLSKLLRADTVTACVFAASKEINHQILDDLEPRLRAKIERDIPADLTKLSKSELLQRLSSPA